MQLIQASHTILSQLASIVEQIQEEDFAKPCDSLGKSTIGQHLRHTLEFFICLEDGCRKGVVNYDKRSHDKLIESDKFIALGALEKIKMFVASHTADHGLRLEVGYEHDRDDCVTIETNYFRELTYNIEHAVHHMALMKIGLRERAPYVVIPPEFGIAVSTLRYQKNSQVHSR